MTENQAAEKEEYAQECESSFRSLVLNLLSAEDQNCSVELPRGSLGTGITLAMRMLEAASNGLLQSLSQISDPNERGDAFSEAEMLIEASLRIALSDAPHAGKAIQRKGGRPASVNPSILQATVFEMMDHHDDFTIDDPEWNAQARLEEAIRDRLNLQLSESRLREIIRPHLAAWRVKKAGNQF